MKRHLMTTGAAILTALTLAACGEQAATGTVGAPATAVQTAGAADFSKDVEGARAFIADAEARLAANSEFVGRTAWNQATNITFDTNQLLSWASAESTKLSVEIANATKQF